MINICMKPFVYMLVGESCQMRIDRLNNILSIFYIFT